MNTPNVLGNIQSVPKFSVQILLMYSAGKNKIKMSCSKRSINASLTSYNKNAKYEKHDQYNFNDELVEKNLDFLLS